MCIRRPFANRMYMLTGGDVWTGHYVSLMVALVKAFGTRLNAAG